MALEKVLAIVPSAPTFIGFGGSLGLSEPWGIIQTLNVTTPTSRSHLGKGQGSRKKEPPSPHPDDYSVCSEKKPSKLPNAGSLTEWVEGNCFNIIAVKKVKPELLLQLMRGVECAAREGKPCPIPS
eukprot:1236324-Amphidinium_carterae.1